MKRLNLITSLICLSIFLMACTENEQEAPVYYPADLQVEEVQPDADAKPVVDIVHSNEPTPRLIVRAATERTIAFQTQNGRTRYGTAPVASMIPHLTLYQNGQLSDPTQRTLHIRISGVQIPPSGAQVTLLVETQHGNPDAGTGFDNRIPVWQETAVIPAIGDTHTQSIEFSHTFAERVSNDSGEVSTPTDYFRIQVRVEGVGDMNGTILYSLEHDFAFLMENQWRVSLPDVPESAPGAAPDELVIYFCDMTPFQKDTHDPGTWVSRVEIDQYVSSELLPRMVAAFRAQSEGWGFPWHDEWTSYRGGEDTERIAVALSDGHTWYHGSVGPRGNASISINVAGGENYSYDTLTDGVMSTFHHELFHNLQRNISQHISGSGNIEGVNGQWQFFTEGMAVLVSSVAQPDVQFAVNAGERAYFTNANLFIGSETISGDLGKNFSEISPYHGAIYWRFLYEQCGGMTGGVENSPAGMAILRRSLKSLYRAMRDTNGQMSLDEGMTAVMDRALTGSTCPFQTYAQSLEVFYQAVNQLGSSTGRCEQPGQPNGCGFYDPNHLYNSPNGSVAALLNTQP